GEPLWLLKLAGWIETVVNAGAVHQGALQAMTNLNVDRAAPGMLRIYKEERTLEIWKQDRTGKYVLLKAYPICNYSGTLGPKIREGDRQAPEGFYEITPEQMNPLSHEYLSFNIGFPNAFGPLLAAPVALSLCMADVDRSAAMP